MILVKSSVRAEWKNWTNKSGMPEFMESALGQFGALALKEGD